MIRSALRCTWSRSLARYSGSELCQTGTTYSRTGLIMALHIFSRSAKGTPDLLRCNNRYRRCRFHLARVESMGAFHDRSEHSVTPRSLYWTILSQCLRCLWRLAPAPGIWRRRRPSPWSSLNKCRLRPTVGLGPRPTVGLGPRSTVGLGPRPTVGLGSRPTVGLGSRPTVGLGPRSTVGSGSRPTVGLGLLFAINER